MRTFVHMGIEAPGSVRVAAIFELSKDRRSTDKSVDLEAAPVEELNEFRCPSSSSSSTSSIGRNSDDVSANVSSEEDSGDNEAQSAYTGPLNRMDALEEVLPIRRGISKFYNGKSKSFATLAAASSSSIKDIVKPENAYTRKRRNLAFNQVWDKHRGFGGIAKKPICSSRSTLALAVAMNSSDSSSSSCTSEDSNSSSTSRSPLIHPPLHPQIRVARNSPPSSPPQQKFSPWRSLSLFDLQQC